MLLRVLQDENARMENDLRMVYVLFFTYVQGGVNFMFF